MYQFISWNFSCPKYSLLHQFRTVSFFQEKFFQISIAFIKRVSFWTKAVWPQSLTIRYTLFTMESVTRARLLILMTVCRLSIQVSFYYSFYKRCGTSKKLMIHFINLVNKWFEFILTMSSMYLHHKYGLYSDSFIISSSSSTINKML